jgi:rRNA-processing protein FCF1
VKVAAAASDRKVSDWISDAVKRELEREEAEAKSRAKDDARISQASLRAFERDWASEDDAVYDELSK